MLRRSIHVGRSVTLTSLTCLLLLTSEGYPQDKEKAVTQKIEISRVSRNPHQLTAGTGHQRDVVYNMREIKVQNEGRNVVAQLLEPESANGDSLLVVELCWESFSNTGNQAFVFHSLALRLGHRILRMDVPQEGHRADSYGRAIPGMNAAIAAHRDIFGEFVRDGRVLLDRCIADGSAKSGRIVAAGISRGGFSAAHLMASDSRISAGAFLAPVTTLSALTEFRENATAQAVTRLNLWNLAKKLAGRRIWLGIGYADTRVDTTAACKFYMALREAENCALSESKVEFYITDDENHTFGKDWYQRAAVSLFGSESLPQAAGTWSGPHCSHVSNRTTRCRGVFHQSAQRF